MQTEEKKLKYRVHDKTRYAYRNHRQAAVKPAACAAKPLMLSTLGREGEIYVGRKGGGGRR